MASRARDERDFFLDAGKTQRVDWNAPVTLLTIDHLGWLLVVAMATIPMDTAIAEETPADAGETVTVKDDGWLLTSRTVREKKRRCEALASAILAAPRTPLHVVCCRVRRTGNAKLIG